MSGQRPEPLDEGSGVYSPAGQGPQLYGHASKAQVAYEELPGDGRTRFAHASVGWLRHPRIELLLMP